MEAAFSASKLSWLLDEVPDAGRRAAAGDLLFGDVNCWLTWHLSGGTLRMSPSRPWPRGPCCSTWPRLAWDPDLLELFGVPAAMLPAVVQHGRAAGRDRPAVCGGRAVIAASVGDQQAALFGQRCWRAGMAKLTLGTGAFLWCHAGGVPLARCPPGVVSSCAWAG